MWKRNGQINSNPQTGKVNMKKGLGIVKVKFDGHYQRESV